MKSPMALVRASECRGRWRVAAAGASAVFGFMFAGSASAQDIRALAEKSSIVVSGKVQRLNASLEPMQKATSRTAVVSVVRMFAGAEIAGDQQGRTITVVLSGQSDSLKPGTEALFFGNPRFLGRTLTMVDEGEMPIATGSPDLESALQARRDLPLRQRLEIATSVFVGKVESEQPVEAEVATRQERRVLPSEHDAQWHVASVRVLRTLSGAAAGTVNVLFPASNDVMWFNAPKLVPGTEMVFIAHPPERDGSRLLEAPGMRAYLERQRALAVSEPFDAVPVAQEGRVRNLLEKGR